MKKHTRECLKGWLDQLGQKKGVLLTEFGKGSDVSVSQEVPGKEVLMFKNLNK